MSHEQSKPMLPRWAFMVGVAVILLSLLVISRWMFLAAHSVFLVYLYRRTNNRGLLIAAGIMMGLAAGILTEILLHGPERVTSAGGVGLALIGMYLFKRKISDGPAWIWPLMGAGFIAVTGLLWSASDEAHAIYLKAYPVGLVALFALSAIQFWRDRRPRVAAAAGA